MEKAVTAVLEDQYAFQRREPPSMLDFLKLNRSTTYTCSASAGVTRISTVFSPKY